MKASRLASAFPFADRRLVPCGETREAEALTVTADKRWLAHGGDAGISVGYRLRF